MYGERPVAGAIDTPSGELAHMAVSAMKNLGGAALGLSTELFRGARELMHADTREIHLPSSIIHR